MCTLLNAPCKLTNWSHLHALGNQPCTLQCANTPVCVSVLQHTPNADARTRARAGQLPVLHVGGVAFAQSAAQLRYAGRLAGLYPVGSDPINHVAALRVDELVETALEVLNKAPNSEDQAKKQELRAEYASGHMTKLLGLLEQRIDENKGPAGRGWSAGAEMTIADVAVFTTVRLIHEGQFDFVGPDFVSAASFPGVAGVCRRFRALPQVEERYGPAPVAAAAAKGVAGLQQPVPKAKKASNALPPPELRTYADNAALGKTVPANLMETLQYVAVKGSAAQPPSAAAPAFTWTHCKPAMVVFWASYAEGDHLVLEACSEIGNSVEAGYVMQTVAISCDPKKELVETFAAAPPVAVNLPLAFDPNRTVRSAFELAAAAPVGVSTVFLVSDEGTIVWTESFSQMHSVGEGQLAAQVKRMCTGVDLIDNGPKPARGGGKAGGAGSSAGADEDELSDLEMSDDVPSDDSDGLLF